MFTKVYLFILGKRLQKCKELEKQNQEKASTIKEKDKQLAELQSNVFISMSYNLLCLFLWTTK